MGLHFDLGSRVAHIYILQDQHSPKMLLSDFTVVGVAVGHLADEVDKAVFAGGACAGEPQRRKETLVTTQQTEKHLEEDDQLADWESEPITLTRSFGDHYWLGLLSTVRLPGRHVHPAVRKAAKQIVAAQAELDQLQRKLAARPGERDELMPASVRHEALLFEWR
jgi:hypothetical protein